MTTPSTIISLNTECIRLFAEMETAQQELSETPEGSSSESETSIRVEGLRQKIGAIFRFNREEPEQSLQSSAAIYAEAVAHHDDKVRFGLASYLDGVLGFNYNEVGPGPFQVTFGLLCQGIFPGAATVGALGNTAPLARELSRMLMLPEAKLRVHPVPSLSGLAFESLASVLYAVFCAKVSDAEALEAAVWEPMSCGVAESEPVVFWVTASLDSRAQLLRVVEMVSAGLAPSVDVAPMRLPFRMRSSVCEARVSIVDFGWPISILNDAAFFSVGEGLKEAAERLVERGIPLDQVMAELRLAADESSDFPVSFFIELQDKNNGVILARVPGQDARWVSAYLPYLCGSIEVLGLHNGATREGGDGPLLYFFA
jgi:hypothetical protein